MVRVVALMVCLTVGTIVAAEELQDPEDPNPPVSHTKVAIRLANEGREEEARIYFNAATRHDPNDPQHWNNLGVSLMRHGMTQVRGGERELGEKALEECLAAFSMGREQGRDSDQGNLLENEQIARDFVKANQLRVNLHIERTKDSTRRTTSAGSIIAGKGKDCVPLCPHL